MLVLLDGHSECMCHCVDTGKAQNTLGGFKMTIENAKALQEQLANEAIAQLRKNGNNELVDDCIHAVCKDRDTRSKQHCRCQKYCCKFFSHILSPFCLIQVERTRELLRYKVILTIRQADIRNPLYCLI